MQVHTRSNNRGKSCDLEQDHGNPPHRLESTNGAGGAAPDAAGARFRCRIAFACVARGGRRLPDNRSGRRLSLANVVVGFESEQGFSGGSLNAIHEVGWEGNGEAGLADGGALGGD